MIIPCWCGSSSCQCRSGSQNFEDAVNRSIGAAVADPDRDDAVDPVVLRGGSLKCRSYPEIRSSSKSTTSPFSILAMTSGGPWRTPWYVMPISASSFVLRTSRTFSAEAPSLRTVCQSLPPSSTSPESRSPSNRPAGTTPTRRECPRRRADTQQLANIQTHHEQWSGAQAFEPLASYRSCWWP